MPAQGIAMYSHDGALVAWIDEKRLNRLVGYGRVARIVRSRTGRIRRAILHRMPGEPAPTFLVDYAGTRYCLRQHLDDGRRCYKLRPLGELRADEHNLAPPCVRPVFLRVLLDCLVPAA